MPDADNARKNYVAAELARLQAKSATMIEHEGDTKDVPAAMEAAAVQLHSRDPATDGKLQEIDLGTDASTRNAGMAQGATHGRPLQPSAQGPTKARLGRDGKPRRKRWRRGSEDVKRDEIVEAIMKETKRKQPLRSPLHHWNS